MNYIEQNVIQINNSIGLAGCLNVDGIIIPLPHYSKPIWYFLYTMPDGITYRIYYLNENIAKAKSKKAHLITEISYNMINNEFPYISDYKSCQYLEVYATL